MRTRVLGALLLVACGSAAEPPVETTAASDTPEPSWVPVAVAGTLELAIRDRAGDHGGTPAAVFRLTNHGDTPLLIDLRQADHVVRPGAPSELREPLTEAQIAELGLISALTQAASGASVFYAVALADCTGEGRVPLGGVLHALDGDRTIEMVADGAEATVSCAPAALPAGIVWVPATAALAGSVHPTERNPERFAVDLPDLIRGAAVSSAADVALLPFSYDGRPIERWRYDACVAVGTCPTRVVPQPPGSIRAPAVGMTAAGVEAFCATRSLRAPTAAEITAMADPGRALVHGDGPDLVVAGFRCARSEEPEPPAP